MKTIRTFSNDIEEGSVHKYFISYKPNDKHPYVNYMSTKVVNGKKLRCDKY